MKIKSKLISILVFSFLVCLNGFGSDNPRLKALLEKRSIPKPLVETSGVQPKPAQLPIDVQMHPIIIDGSNDLHNYDMRELQDVKAMVKSLVEDERKRIVSDLAAKVAVAEEALAKERQNHHKTQLELERLQKVSFPNTIELTLKVINAAIAQKDIHAKPITLETLKAAMETGYELPDLGITLMPQDIDNLFLFK